jgi:hypothetical protein
VGPTHPSPLYKASCTPHRTVRPTFLPRLRLRFFLFLHEQKKTFLGELIARKEKSRSSVRAVGDDDPAAALQHSDGKEWEARAVAEGNTAERGGTAAASYSTTSRLPRIFLRSRPPPSTRAKGTRTHPPHADGAACCGCAGRQLSRSPQATATN